MDDPAVGRVARLLAEDFDLSLVGFSDGELDKLLAFVPEGKARKKAAPVCPR